MGNVDPDEGSDTWRDVMHVLQGLSDDTRQRFKSVSSSLALLSQREMEMRDFQTGLQAEVTQRLHEIAAQLTVLQLDTIERAKQDEQRRLERQAQVDTRDKEIHERLSKVEGYTRCLFYGVLFVFALAIVILLVGAAPV